VRIPLLVLAVPLTLVLGCGSEDEPKGHIASDAAVDRAERFTAFEIPWLGREWEGMPLAFVDLPPGRRGPAYLTYGQCNEFDPGSGCAYELDIQINPSYEYGCEELPSRRIGGVAARVDRRDHELRLFGKHLTVVITAFRRRDVVPAAEALEPVNEVPADAPRLKKCVATRRGP